MLWALALLGILPAAFVMNGEIDEDEVTSDAGGDASTEDVSAVEESPEEVTPVEDDRSEEDASPESTLATYDFTADGEDVVVSDFEPGEDTLTWHLLDDGLGTMTVDTILDDDEETIGVSLSYFDGDTQNSIDFLGLTELPENDVTIGITDPETGEETFFALALFDDDAALEPNDPTDADVETVQEFPSEEVISPNAAEGPSTLVEYELRAGGDTLVLEDEPLAEGTETSIVVTEDSTSIDTNGKLNIVTGSDGGDTISVGDAASVVYAGEGDDTLVAGDGTTLLYGGSGDDTIEGGHSENSGYVLDGEAGDDTITGGAADEVIIGGTGADTLNGGAGDDTLLIDNNDVASGGEGNDTFVLSEDEVAEDGFAKITDFETGIDMLSIAVAAEDVGDDPLEVNVELTEDGASSQVIVNGDVVAVLYGATDVSINDLNVAVSA
jgi:Ca2+-binding RTX toxin-like protein